MKFNKPDREPVGGNFLRLGDGKSVIGVFRGDPFTFYQSYENGRYRVVPSTDANGKFAFKINFIVKEGDSLVAKIFQGNYFDYTALMDLHDEFDLEKVYIQISQTGERQNKRISFLPRTKQKPDEKKIASVPLIGFGQNPDESFNGNEPSFDSEEIPF